MWALPTLPALHALHALLPCLPCLPYLPGTRRAQPLAELSLSERSEDSAVNRALRARIRRKLEAVKQEATQLPRLNSLGRRESVLSTYGILRYLLSYPRMIL